MGDFVQDFNNIALFTVGVGGVSFTMRRRSTATMAQVGDVNQVLGLLSKGSKNPEDFSDKQMEKANEQYNAMVARVWDMVVAINGEPVENLTITKDLKDAVQDALFSAFLGSGLDADPMPGSSEGGVELSLSKPLTD